MVPKAAVPSRGSAISEWRPAASMASNGRKDGPALATKPDE
jgi:hypothetical protein